MDPVHDEPERTTSLVGALVEVSTNVDASDADSISLCSASSLNDGRQRKSRGKRNKRKKSKVDDAPFGQSSNRQSRQQMIESLVRFSYHTPSAVLEDLINHELKLCELEESQVKRYQKKISDEGPRHENDDRSAEESLGMSSLSSAEIDTAEGSISTKVSDAADAKVHYLLPPNRIRNSALVFIDISGFTKLSTMLDEETLSRVINSYFEMIIGEVKAHGGDVLKFAGDALFVEWRDSEMRFSGEKCNAHVTLDNNSKVLQELNSSFTSVATPCDRSTSSGLPIAVLRATRCATAIVNKYSDHEVVVHSHVPGTLGVLNVHCGIGCGELVGIHTSDCNEEDGMGEEEQTPETRREYLFLGKAIDQVSKAANMASNGEVVISTDALRQLAECCNVPNGMIDCLQPVCIASRSSVFIDLTHRQEQVMGDPTDISEVTVNEESAADQSLRRHCLRMQLKSLSRLHSQAALYVHPVVRRDVWGLYGHTMSTTGSEDIQQRYHIEAELRTIFTVFIKAMVTPELTGNSRTDNVLFSTLRTIMHLTCRELDRFSGQLRQYIVDDKGVVLIVVFGLRGSTFSDMVANNALPACFAIQKALSASGISTRIGGTLGKAYCGVVGALRRHEFSVMGAPVNLSARLMDSPMNSGLLVDENIRNHANGKFAFRSLQPVKAKGYDAPVIILEPVHEMSSRLSRKSKIAKFVGREDEKKAIVNFAQKILDDQFNPHASIVNVVGDSGIGKSTLCVAAMNDIKTLCWKRRKVLVSLRSSSTEDQQRIPLCAFRKILLGAIRELCFNDGSISEQRLENSTDNWHTESSLKSSKHLYDDRPNLVRHSTSGDYHGSFVPQVQKETEETRPLVLTRSGSFVLHPGARSLDARGRFPYLEKLRWACCEAGYDGEYADLIASQFLGIDDSRTITHVNGEVPQIGDLVECIAQSFIKIVDFADITVIFIDDFQWVDTFTWRVVRALSQSAKRMLIVRASKSHDKRALRRLSNGMSKGVSFSMEITLGPLELDDIRDLISQILMVSNEDKSIDEEVCTYIYQKTGGLPVYVLELLENLKRTNSFVVGDGGNLRLALRNSHEGEECSALVLNQMLNRFDSLDALVRKLLHTCAVLGQSFSFSDVVRVHHPDIKMALIEDSLNVAVSEMILVELDSDEDKSTCSVSSHGGSHSHFGASVGHSKTSSRLDIEGERNFEFSHDMWRKTVLATLLEARKVKLHRLIAIAMEKEFDGGAIEQSDLSCLLTLFEHWKLCGEFKRAAPLALIVSERLNDWDLVDLSVDICRDALDMSLRSVTHVENNPDLNFGDWREVSSTPSVFSFIIRLNVRIAENYRLLGRIMKCVKSYEDAYMMLHSCSTRTPSLLITVLVGLLRIDFERNESNDSSDENVPGDEALLEEFLQTAREESHPIHIAMALSMKAQFYSQRGYFEQALEESTALCKVYNAGSHSRLLSTEYGKDHAMDVLSQSAMWFFLSGQEQEAVDQSLFVVKQLLPHLNPTDVDTIMTLLLPAILVLKFVGRGEDAHFIFCRYVVNAHHDNARSQTPWVEIFNPLIYLLEIVKMEELDTYDDCMLDAIQDWVLNDNNSYYSPDHLRLGHTLMGEICYRLGQLKPATDDSMREMLLQKARSFLTPIARDVQSEAFLAHSALAFLRAMD
ncbi:adenylate/guanylate cyclase [Nitzschia inconspicua]|uniref:Adenylate/guanylate cyclase n=1 Tax=Nitzschia inconspicua TaxID=303405 RepID=A0A9K3LFK6_9STRA|nr:adenylate/guanylate cyclase [Nitzschia inconspicua]